MKKILIIYATAGEGHKQASLSIKRAFEILNPPDVEIRTVDALDYSNRLFKWAYPRIYLFMVRYFPTLWGFFYYCLDLKWLYPVVRFIRRVTNKANTSWLERFLCGFNPDVIISTHFLACEVASNLKRKNRISAKLITCVTDYRMHSFWFSREADAFCVSFPQTGKDLSEKWKVPPQKINVLGMPVNPVYNEPKDKDGLCVKMGIPKGTFTVLVVSGGFGVGPIRKLVRALIAADLPIQVFVVCGHNEKLQKEIDSICTICCRYKARIATFGFIDYVDELMGVSDVAITKAGGLVCSEAVSKNLPMIIVAPIPGQESRNRKFLLKSGAALKLNRPSQLEGLIKAIYHDPVILKRMRENISAMKKENSAVSIAKFTLGA